VAGATSGGIHKPNRSAQRAAGAPVVSTTIAGTPRPHLWAIVLAGGFGRRMKDVIHALTGAHLPKQFCRFGSSRSLLQETITRLQPLIPTDRTVLVVDATFEMLSRAQTSEWPDLRTVVQPLERGTGPGTLLPLVHVLLRDPEATLVLTPSDHGIADVRCFQDGVLRAAESLLRDRRRVVLLGVTPDAPATDYGWIVPAAPPRGARQTGVRPVAEFVEKPPPGVARRLLERGALWNTLILVTRARTLLGLFRRHLRELASFFTIYAGLAPSDRDAWLRERYHSLPRVDFSHDLLAVARNLSVVNCPAAMGWADLGSPERLFDWLSRRGRPVPAALARARAGAASLVEHPAVK
jgi:mannose-1-phosphate guanylyltransferase